MQKSGVQVGQEICDWIDGASFKEELAIQRAEQEVVLLQEFRARLVADVVTGKLDIRVAAGLPEVGEIEPFEDLADDGDFDEPPDDPENEEVAA